MNQDASAAVGLGFGSLCCIGFFALVGLALCALWIYALVDCVKNEPSEGNDKIVWLLVIIFLHALGAIIYLAVRRPKRISQHGH